MPPRLPGETQARRLHHKDVPRLLFAACSAGAEPYFTLHSFTASPSDPSGSRVGINSCAT